MVNSPITTLASSITASSTTISLVDSSKLPTAPNLATIGKDESSETILYTGKSGNNLTGVTRGFQGTAKAWNVGDFVARYFTAYDHNTFISNISEIDVQLMDYSYDVVTSDANGKPTYATYKRTNDTLYKNVTCSNPDANGYYQTIVEKTYDVNGTTLKQTKTYTLTYNTDGIIQSKRWVVS